MFDGMLNDLEDFIRSVSDAAGEEPPKFRRSDLAEHLTAFLDQVEDGDAEFAFGLPTPYEEGKHPRGYGGKWVDKPGGGRESAREFTKRVNGHVEERPDIPVFHHPARLRVEKAILQVLAPLAGKHGEASLMFDPKYQSTSIWLGDKMLGGVSLENGKVLVQDQNVDRPRRAVFDTASLPGPEEMEYRIKKTLGLKVSPESQQQYGRAHRQAEEQQRHTEKVAEAVDLADEHLNGFEELVHEVLPALHDEDHRLALVDLAQQAVDEAREPVERLQALREFRTEIKGLSAADVEGIPAEKWVRARSVLLAPVERAEKVLARALEGKPQKKNLGDAEFAFGLPTPYEEGKHPRGYHGKWVDKPGAAVPGALRDAVHGYIRENGPATHEELVEHLSDQGVKREHAPGLLRAMEAKGHLHRAADEYGREAYHLPPAVHAEAVRSYLKESGEAATQDELLEVLRDREVPRAEGAKLLAQMTAAGQLQSGQDAEGRDTYALPKAARKTSTRKGRPQGASALGGAPLTPAGATESPSRKPAVHTPEQLTEALSRDFPEMVHQGVVNPLSGMAHLWDLRDWVAKKYGAHAAGDAVFNEGILGLWRRGGWYLNEVSDYGRLTREQLAKSITVNPGAGRPLERTYWSLEPLPPSTRFTGTDERGFRFEAGRFEGLSAGHRPQAGFSLQDAYLAPGGQSLLVPGSSGIAAFDEVALDSDAALPWLEHYHRRGQHPPEWPVGQTLPGRPVA